MKKNYSIKAIVAIVVAIIAIMAMAAPAGAYNKAPGINSLRAGYEDGQTVLRWGAKTQKEDRYDVAVLAPGGRKTVSHYKVGDGALRRKGNKLTLVARPDGARANRLYKVMVRAKGGAWTRPEEVFFWEKKEKVSSSTFGATEVFEDGSWEITCDVFADGIPGIRTEVVRSLAGGGEKRFASEPDADFVDANEVIRVEDGEDAYIAYVYRAILPDGRKLELDRFKVHVQPASESEGDHWYVR